ncbi:MAG: hypothetical protein Q9209_001027 [Squamulea sp. 1 TL-2023]
MFGPFRATSPLSGGLLWKIPFRLSAPQKARQRKRLRAVDTVIAVVDSALRKQGNSLKEVERWKAEMPSEEEMRPKDKYTVFDRKEKRYRKGIHKDLADLFPRRTTRGMNIEQLLREEKYFVRLDTCSLKDAIIGRGPIRDSKDLWTRLATSARGVTGIRAMRDNLPEQPVDLFLMKWNDRMRTDLEYRVFCASASGEIAAISQYKWRSPWYHPKEDSGVQEVIAKRVFEGAKAIHARIKANPVMTEDFKERGYGFDMIEDPEDGNSVGLIELNDFGAMTGCGSC